MSTLLSAACFQVCVQYALKVFRRDQVGRLLASDFMRMWHEALPSEFSPSLDMLKKKGEVLLEGPSGQTQYIRPFSVRDLPKDPAKRFAVLFEERPSWEWPELEPYLKGLRVPGQSEGALLLKYARCSQKVPDAPMVYCAR